MNTATQRRHYAALAAERASTYRHGMSAESVRAGIAERRILSTHRLCLLVNTAIRLWELRQRDGQRKVRA